MRTTTRGVADRALLSRTSAIVLGTLAYIATLHYIYQINIAPQFSYLQYTYREPDPLHYGVAIAIAVALAAAMPGRIVRPSHFIAWMLFIVVVVPSLMVPQYSDVLSVDAAAELSYWVGLGYLPVAVLGCRRVLRGFVPRLRIEPARFWLAIGIAAGLADGFVLLIVGIGGLELPSLNDVYTLRGEFAETESGHASLNYLIPFMVNVINPLLMTRGLFGRRWLWLAFGTAGQLLIYASSGNKSAVLSPAALLLGYALFRAARRPAAGVILLGTIVVSWAMALMDWITATNDWTSLMVRRFLITPGLLTAGYVAVFSDMEKTRWAYGFLSSFFVYPYLGEPSDIVGAQFFGRSSTHANANMLADGFANLGHPGMLLECLVLVVLLWLIDDAARGIPLGVASLLFLVLSLSLADSGIFTSVLTDGFLLAILICAALPRTGWSPKRAPAAH